MKKVLLLIVKTTFAQDTEASQISEEEYLRKVDSVNNSFKYQEGTISLENGIA